MITIELGGRTIPLIYTVWEMKQVQEDIGPLSRAMDLAMGKNPDDEEDRSMFLSKEHLKAATAMIRIMGNAGLEEAGEKADLTDKGVGRAIKPKDLPEAISACMAAMNEGLLSEIPKKPEEPGPVDVVLEEIEKKKEADS